MCVYSYITAALQVSFLLLGLNKMLLIIIIGAFCALIVVNRLCQFQANEYNVRSIVLHSGSCPPPPLFLEGLWVGKGEVEGSVGLGEGRVRGGGASIDGNCTQMKKENKSIDAHDSHLAGHALCRIPSLLFL